jgi:hypothetical protein
MVRSKKAAGVRKLFKPSVPGFPPAADPQKYPAAIPRRSYRRDSPPTCTKSVVFYSPVAHSSRKPSAIQGEERCLPLTGGSLVLPIHTLRYPRRIASPYARRWLASSTQPYQAFSSPMLSTGFGFKLRLARIRPTNFLISNVYAFFRGNAAMLTSQTRAYLTLAIHGERAPACGATAAAPQEGALVCPSANPHLIVLGA